VGGVLRQLAAKGIQEKLGAGLQGNCVGRQY
jgi:hypothetical protein